MGCVVGDYTKSAINTSIFTGKLIGVCSMLYGFVTTNVPSFVNYARSFGQMTDMNPTSLRGHSTTSLYNVVVSSNRTGTLNSSMKSTAKCCRADANWRTSPFRYRVYRLRVDDVAKILGER